MMRMTPGLALARIRMAGYYAVNNLDHRSILVLAEGEVIQLPISSEYEVDPQAVDEILFRLEGRERRALTIAA